MVYPSGIRRPEGQELRSEQVAEGLHVITNAYEGVYEYFEGIPITTIAPSASSSEQGEQTASEDYVAER